MRAFGQSADSIWEHLCFYFPPLSVGELESWRVRELDSLSVLSSQIGLFWPISQPSARTRLRPIGVHFYVEQSAASELRPVSCGRALVALGLVQLQTVRGRQSCTPARTQSARTVPASALVWRSSEAALLQCALCIGQCTDWPQQTGTGAQLGAQLRLKLERTESAQSAEMSR